MTIGNRIKKCRLSLHLNQTELSKQLNLSPRMVSFYESGQRIPPADILIKLARIFNVSSDYLLGLSDTTTNTIHLDKTLVNPEEEVFLSIFRNLDKDYKDIVLGELKKCMKLQEQEYSHSFTGSPHRKKQA